MTLIGKQKGIKQVEIKMTPSPPAQLINPSACICKRSSFLISTQELETFAYTLVAIIGQLKDSPYELLSLPL